MKTLFTTLSFLFTFTLFAQDVTVTPSITSLQANLGAIYLVHEKGLSDDITLRLEAGIRQQFHYTSPETLASYYGLRPILGVGARHYYNLNKRAEKGKRTENNSGNFVGIIAQYRPDFFVYNSNENINASNYVDATAQWGIRRQIGRRFDFEFTAGLNFRPGGRLFGRRSIIGGSFPHLDFRFGYRF
jgi:hypothetical protein